MRNLIFLFFAWLAFVPMANAVGSGEVESSEFYNCNLPAPSDLQITNVTGTSATGSWSAVPGAVAYKVEVEEISTGTIVYTNTVTGTSETATGLAPGTNYKFNVAPICSNGVQSQNWAFIDFSTNIVIEITSAGYSPSCLPPNGLQKVFLPFAFDVERNKNYIGNIYLSCVNGSDQLLTKYKFRLSDDLGEPQAVAQLDYITGISAAFITDDPTAQYAQYPLLGGSEIHFKLSSNSTAGKGVVHEVNGADKLIISNASTAPLGCRYTFDLYECRTTPKSIERNPSISSSEIEMMISPNPFLDIVTLNINSEEDYNIEIINQYGKTIKHFNGVIKENFQINMGGEMPGVYYLKLQHEDKISVKSIIKL